MALSTYEPPYALVVDDDLLVRMVATEILEDAGLRVLEADHGDGAYDLLTRRYSEIILLFTDVQMPGDLDGFALARRVAVSWPHISILVASGQARPGPTSIPAKAHFITKPFSDAVVREHLRELLPVDFLQAR